MIIKLFSVYDVKTAVYTPVFPALTCEGAKRQFGDMVGDSNHVYGKHPADFTLFYVADYDDSNGKILPLTAFDNLGNGVDFIVSK